MWTTLGSWLIISEAPCNTPVFSQNVPLLSCLHINNTTQYVGKSRGCATKQNFLWLSLLIWLCPSFRKVFVLKFTWKNTGDKAMFFEGQNPKEQKKGRTLRFSWTPCSDIHLLCSLDYDVKQTSLHLYLKRLLWDWRFTLVSLLPVTSGLLQGAYTFVNTSSFLARQWWVRFG